MIALAAALVASASITAPIAVGTVASSTQVAHDLSIQPDPGEGVWLQFTGPEGQRLVRIHEDGRVTPVELPPQLRGEGLEITPLRNGWTVALARYWPGGLQEQLSCQPGSSSSSSALTARPRTRVAAFTRCSELVLAQLSPKGRWTKAQTIPHSFGTESQASEPVLADGRIELAWSEAEQFQPIRVAVARPGHPLGHVHLAHLVLHREANRVLFPVLHGALYLRGEYAPNPPFGTVRFWVDRRLRGDGTLGPAHVVRGRVLREPGLSIEGANGSELWLYGEVYQPLLFARRSSWAPTFEAPRVIVKESDGGEQVVQSQNRRTLISLETPVAGGRSRISAVEISARGHLGPLRGVEEQPANSEDDIGWASAIVNAGSTLIATSGGESAGQIWLHASGARCPGFHSKVLLTGAGKGELAVGGGRRGVFHVAWIDALNEVQSTRVQVGCARSG
jgi:hypothetical protein